jgi:hypothetical protein
MVVQVGHALEALSSVTGGGRFVLAGNHEH